MDALILTLGHNSSAIHIRDGNVMSGYEEERLSEIKSDSAFPWKSIKQIQLQGQKKFDKIFVGHWFLMGQLTDSKYAQLSSIVSLLNSGNFEDIVSVNPHFTHHDSHMMSAFAFSQQYGFPFDKDTAILVADGFGTFSEAISLYKWNIKKSKFEIDERRFGFQNSLGLFYQYSTAFQQMKMHNHEYKMLGYEAHINELEIDQINILNELVEEGAKKRIDQLKKPYAPTSTDPIVDVEALKIIQQQINDELSYVTKTIGVSLDDIYKFRIACSYYTQRVVEAVMLDYIKRHNIKRLVVVGGLFYNVKLNNLLSKQVEKFCAMPLAGDQGAGLGLYHDHYGDLKFPKHLDWGERLDTLHDYKMIDNDQSDNESIQIFRDRRDAYNAIKTAISAHGFVNFVDKSMEFGPRSLGYTATIAKPTKQMTSLINKLNDRTEVMPMAPMMTKEQLLAIAKHPLNIYGSLEYMITAVDLKPELCDKMKGAAHFYIDPLTGEETVTCRPQVVDSNPMLRGLCEEFGPLINTSFNNHGFPIVYNASQVIRAHNYMVSNAPKDVTVTTIILVNG